MIARGAKAGFLEERPQATPEMQQKVNNDREVGAVV
jgi:hypothetical protein